MAARSVWPIISWQLAFLTLIASASIIRGPRSPAESATGRFFVAPHPDNKFLQPANEIGAATKEEKEHGAGDLPPGTNWLGLGALSNMQTFFGGLRDYLESMEEEPLYPEVKNNDLMMATEPMMADLPVPSFNRRPLHATAAYIHALRNHKPSAKIRNFVAHVEPSDLRGSNTYDPAWLWTGLGRRRR